MGRERDKRTQTMEIASVEHGIAIQKAERKRDREWGAISNRLQKQLGEEQTRVAHLQLQSVRQERMFKFVRQDLNNN